VARTGGIGDLGPADAQVGRQRAAQPAAPILADVAVLALGIVAYIVIVFDVGGPVRAVAALAAALVLPGWALRPALPVIDPWARACVVIVTGVAVQAIGALAMVWTGYWYPRACGCAVFGVAALALIVQLRHRLFNPNARYGGRR
jgi:hypothetical protein